MGKLTGKKNNLFKHGGYSSIRQYSEGNLDRRTSMGKYVEDVKRGLVQEIGKPSPAQEILLQLIMQKIAFVSAIAEYCNRQETQIVDHSGALLPVLGKSYLGFSNALGRDLKILFELQEQKKQTEREKDDDGYLLAVMGGNTKNEQTD